MTTRHSGYLVTLAEDVREDDAESVITALRMVRGVIDVRPVEAAGHLEVLPEIIRARIETSNKLLDFVRELRR